MAWRDLGEFNNASPRSSEVRARVESARKIQRDRGYRSNAEIPDARLNQEARASASTQRLLGRAVDNLGLSARGARRALRVALTIADLSQEECVTPAALAEALGYRNETKAEIR